MWTCKSLVKAGYRGERPIEPSFGSQQVHLTSNPFLDKIRTGPRCTLKGITRLPFSTPCGYKKVIAALQEDYGTIIMPELEADDSMGIYATQYPGNIIVSPDKDMRQIPGRLYDFKETTLINEEEGRNWHYIQTLAGDQTDGYSGVPGIGVKRAVAIFEKDGYTWETIKNTFAAKDLEEDVALMNARLAKILTKGDYDFDSAAPILWTPTASN